MHLIPIVLDAVSGRRQTITVFGTDYDTPDGTCLRDYIHVSDLADAHVKALEALRSGAPSGAYNLGNGRGFSVREVISAAEKATGLKVPVVFGARRPGDPAQLISDATKAREALGWQPQIAGLSEILSTAWAWHQRKPGGAGPVRVVRGSRRAGNLLSAKPPERTKAIALAVETNGLVNSRSILWRMDRRDFRFLLWIVL